MATQSTFSFTNRFYNAIPEAYQHAAASVFADNHLVCINDTARNDLMICADHAKSENFLAMITGQQLPPNGFSAAQVYAGHQFGQYVPQLGDGRALNIGELKTDRGEYYELQLKGAGITPFSRHGDGRAVLRSTIREYLASEAMHQLDIPTTRALAITSTSEQVWREQAEPGAILTRFATSHIRFGHFEYFFHHNKKATLNKLADFCLTHYFPEQNKSDNPHLAMLQAIVERTARLIAKWQAVGFTHGVLNTDNMSILGLTIDYGPFGFLDTYQPSFISNTSDHTGRYAFEQQPSIGLWNLNALAYTFSTWLNTEQIRQALRHYEPVLVSHYNELMAQKLGFSQWRQSDTELIGQLLAIMAQQQADYTRVFRQLSYVDEHQTSFERCQALLDEFADQQPIEQWLNQYKTRLRDNPLARTERVIRQNQVNPKYILRNYLAQNAINSAYAGDYSEIARLQTILATPFDEQPRYNAYAKQAPQWGKELNISCSS
ncbi:YdiU family protein [Thalassotalea sp. LPB0316]|uniref:protein adenylyltransferase SelO n=1 Tax=Thalassotalea sp. LPB0316 TaxID=2769490 RepID=UPI0018691682|nr:YdiU family protein [Thalassotalea sp. LPB0316]QOL26291.1 YdiU family protein [Thalassotalea sp. LPB0316]